MQKEKLPSAKILCIHGFLGNSKDFLFYEKDFFLKSIALPGHGGAPFVSKKTFLKHLASYPPMHVIAYSMGARLALEALFEYKAPFLSLTCLSTTLEIENVTQRQEQEKCWIKMLQNNSITTFVDNWYRSPLFHGFSIPSVRYKQNKENIIKALQEFSILKSPSFKKNILHSKTPISFIYRENDPKSLPLEGFKNLYFVEAKSHAIHLEVPQKINLLLKNILTFNNSE